MQEGVTQREGRERSGVYKAYMWNDIEDSTSVSRKLAAAKLTQKRDSRRRGYSGEGIATIKSMVCLTD